MVLPNVQISAVIATQLRKACITQVQYSNFSQGDQPAGVMACKLRTDYVLRDTLQAFATVAGIISLDTTSDCGKLNLGLI